MSLPARIHLSPPHVGARERELLLDAFDSNWIAPLGPHVDAFERELAQAAGVSHAAALSSGTAALHLALRLLGVGPGDEVLTSTLTFAATANAIVYTGATPVFVDSETTSWNIDPALVGQAIEDAIQRGKRPAAVIAVDLYGQTCDWDALTEICARHDVPLLEDAAEALGATCRGRPAGSFGAMSAFSFNGNKIITTSGGGALASNDVRWTDRARFLATQARDPAPHYEHTEVGHNYRLSNLLAAVGRGQLEALPARVARRRQLNAQYRQALGHLPGLTFQPEAPWGTSTFWLTCVTVDPVEFGASREEVRRALEAANIEARPVWKPMHLQPVFRHCLAVGGEVSKRLFELGLCLPSGSSMSDADQARVVDVVRRVARA